MHYLAKGSEVENPYDLGDISEFSPARIACLDNNSWKWLEMAENDLNSWKEQEIEKHWRNRSCSFQLRISRNGYIMSQTITIVCISIVIKVSKPKMLPLAQCLLLLGHEIHDECNMIQKFKSWPWEVSS